MFAVIGDVHGCVRTLEELLSKLLKNYNVENFVFVGDLVDRGGYSKEVLDLVIDFSKSYECKFLLGNHEDMMVDYFEGTNRYHKGDWFYNGGKETIKSFDSDLYKKLLLEVDIKDDFIKKYDNYLEFIKGFDKYTIIDGIENYFISHAGCLSVEIAPQFHIDLVTEEEKKILFPYIWAREIDFYNKKIENYVIIHGHTPVMKIERGYRPFVNKDEMGNMISINIDTGCVYGYFLSALIMDEKSGEYDFEVVDCID
ncbi:metallophosphoesterase [Deferribacter desulfuricans SSM1]|uniref:Metallophosphoesterase n=1 Tax=Deferribacter desulfuricans (strain DSM 14783 / JCM 11476 / NBRC 101012 / SSM1) TaxID=639282 RepID=D3PE10_DEFDS|nr:metallophosphoesterase [Deferribacter desulfuricans]BAI80833.1 metallophosphoesterase [Deferribacter desulfuricans SSM1]